MKSLDHTRRIARICKWSLPLVLLACAATRSAHATITQGDFSLFGFFETREEGRWGEGGSANNGTPTTLFHPTPTTTLANVGLASSTTGGSFDFNHWDLDEMRQLLRLHPDYHIVRNYKLAGRIDTLFLKDADLFAMYRPWYDAFGSIKNRGRADPDYNWYPYAQRALQQTYSRNDLHEYYAQLNFTDSFSARVGKQQVIWSEADALSGTEVTNSVDTTYHGLIPFESPDDLRKNVRMVKFNWILPDYLKTANNEFEAFWIPGDFQGIGGVANVADSRSPWALASATSGPNGQNNLFNQAGQPIQVRSFLQVPAFPMVNLGTAGAGFFAYQNVINTSRDPSNALQNSEFGLRLSSLLPIGNGLQASFIYLYEWRDVGTAALTGIMAAQLLPGVYRYGVPGSWQKNLAPQPGVPVVGTLDVFLSRRFRRNQFFGLTGTYYDKDFTDMVFRYDLLYTPNASVVTPGNHVQWMEFTRFIVAADRPTYISWLSKQHTFLTAQYVNTWLPNRPSNAYNSISNQTGRPREDNNFFFLAATNWIANAQLTTTNAYTMDIDDMTMQLQSTNVYRYSANILLGVNAVWYLGRSGRYTDPFLQSVSQRTNELEFTFTYEI